jgi:hypothetical protein
MINNPVRSTRGLRIAVFALFATFLLVGQVAGQSRQSGEIRGTVTDASGAVIPGVAITITNVSTGVVQRTTTDATGLYDAPFVPLGMYSVSFAKEGFKQFIRSNIEMRLETITLNAELEVGTTSQSITVTAPVALVETENAEQSTTLMSGAVKDLPNVGASWYNFLALIPGVNQGGSSMNYGGANGSNVGVNGMGGLNSNWQVDGGRAFLVMDVNPDWMQPALDDIQEIKMLTANFGAEYGNGTSVFNVVTKSGTNRFHGDAFEYAENDKLDARNWFTIGPKTPLRWNKFGGAIGGPIKHDKLFFHFNYQQNTNINDIPAFATVPTPDMLAGKFDPSLFQTIYDPATLTIQNGNYVNQPFPNNAIPQSRFDKVSSAIAANYPQPNIPGISNNYYWVYRQTEPGKWWNTKIDYNITSSQRLTGNFEIVHAGLGYPAADPAIDNSGWHIKEYQSEITDVWTMSPRLVGEFRVSIAREYGQSYTVNFGKGWPQKLGLANPVADMFPDITIEGTLSTNPNLGFSGEGEDTEVGFGPAADFTWVRGKHVIKWGGELTRDWYNGNGYQEGVFDFGGTFDFTRQLYAPPNTTASNGEGFADFLLGLPDSWSVGDYPTIGQRMWSAQPFVQDEYKIRPNLTLSAGVRWVIQSGYGEAFNRISNFDPTLINAATGTPGAMTYAGGASGWTHLENTHYHFFAPRAGFAWTPKPNWSIRGGYGIFSILWSQANYANADNVGQGWGISGLETSSDHIHPIFTMQQGPPPPLYPTSATRTNDFLNGQSVGYVSANIPMGYNQQYRLDVQHQFQGGVLIDVAYVGNRSLHMPATYAWRDKNFVPEKLLGPGNMQAVRPFPQFGTINDYDPVDYGEYNSLQITAKKDMGHGMMFQANYAWSHSLDSMTANGGTGAPQVWQDAYTPQADYGNSPVDQRNVLNGDFIYRLPVGRGRHFLNSGGWSDTVLGGWELTSVFTARNGNPFTPLMGTSDSGEFSGSWRPNRIASGKLAHPNINEWFDTSAFVQPAPYAFGNSGRDILYGPTFTDMDFALSKKFPISKLGEGGSLTIKAETYDTFDSPNFALPNANIGTSNAGTITSALNNRLLQFGLMLNF